MIEVDAKKLRLTTINCKSVNLAPATNAATTYVVTRDMNIVNVVKKFEAKSSAKLAISYSVMTLLFFRRTPALKRRSKRSLGEPCYVFVSAMRLWIIKNIDMAQALNSTIINTIAIFILADSIKAEWGKLA